MPTVYRSHRKTSLALADLDLPSLQWVPAGCPLLPAMERVLASLLLCSCACVRLIRKLGFSGAGFQQICAQALRSAVKSQQLYTVLLKAGTFVNLDVRRRK